MKINNERLNILFDLYLSLIRENYLLKEKINSLNKDNLELCRKLLELEDIEDNE